MSRPFDAWLAEGDRNGWVRYVCLQHDWLVTDDEAERLDEGDDPCLPRMLLAPPPPAPLDVDPRQQALFDEA